MWFISSRTDLSSFEASAPLAAVRGATTVAASEAVQSHQTAAGAAAAPNVPVAPTAATKQATPGPSISVAAGGASSIIAVTTMQHHACAAAAESVHLELSDCPTTILRQCSSPDQQGAALGTVQRGGVPAERAAATVTKPQPRAPVAAKRQHHKRKHSNGIAKCLFCPWVVKGGGHCEIFSRTKADDEPQDGCEPGQVSLICPPRRMLGHKQAAAKQ